jgi:hypothetical protein
MAWQRISPEVSVKGFKCISIAMDALMLWNDSEETADGEEDEGTDGKDVDSDTDW